MADLFKPYKMGGLEIRNRLVRSATTSAWADERGVYLGRGEAIMEALRDPPPGLL
jgi:2,4-dienoyl-CoA reductase-like NADH-dependent reductase (Old Yellow Enzyme family)